MRTGFARYVAVTSVVVAACGGDDDGNPGVDAMASYTMEGSVHLQVFKDQGGLATAKFTTSKRCTEEPMGSCAVRTCSTETLQRVSAGVISISGGAAPVTLTPVGTAYADAPTPVLYAGGETLTLTAAGADVPAFTTSLTATSAAHLTSPVIDATSPDVVVDRANDLAITWTGGSEEILVLVSRNGDPSKVVACYFAASSGEGSVPAAALAMLAPGPGSMAFVATSRALVITGDYGVHIDAFLDSVAGTAVIQ